MTQITLVEEKQRAAALLSRIRNMEEEQATRVAVIREELKTAAEYIENSEAQMEKKEQDEKIRILVLGEKLKAPNAAMDWERDSNSSASVRTNDIDLCKDPPNHFQSSTVTDSLTSARRREGQSSGFEPAA